MTTLNDLITVRVKFPSGEGTYDYAAPKNWGVRPGDYATVHQSGRTVSVYVVEVLHSLTQKTTRGIISHTKHSTLADDLLQTRTKERAEVLRQVDALMEKQKYALAASMDSNLKQKLEELGLL